MFGGQCAVAAKRRLPKPKGVIEASCFTALAQAAAMATDGSRPSMRSAEKNTVSPAARIGATRSATNWCAVAGRRPSDR